jgi:asparagine synthase (glutamine-hydrolysing)
LERAVRKRLMSEVPYGVLLSGGLDSSLIAAIAARETERVLEAQKARGLDGSDIFTSMSNGEGAGIGPDDEDDSSGLAAWPRLHSFSVGLPGSPDLLAAREVAKFLGTVHHEHTFTLEEGLDALQDVIYHLETYDVTTIRASTPMYLLSRKIKAQGVKMVLSGEGSDEIFAGMTPGIYLAYNRLPLFPRCSIPGGPPRRMRCQSQKLELCGLSESKQVYHGLGSRGPCPIPR